MISNELAYSFLTFMLGLLSGYTAGRYGEDIKTRLTPALDPDELEDLSSQLRDTAHRLNELATITDRLADGETAEDIEATMSPDMQEAWEKYKEEHL